MVSTRAQKKVVVYEDFTNWDTSNNFKETINKVVKYTHCEVCGKDLQDISQHYRVSHPYHPKQKKRKRRTNIQINYDKANIELKEKYYLNNSNDLLLFKAAQISNSNEDRFEYLKEREFERRSEGIYLKFCFI